MRIPDAKSEKREGVVRETGSWMTTYTDLMTLLLTFFVLLLSLSVIDAKKQRLALNSLIGAFGFKPGGNAVMGEEEGLNITAGAIPMTKEEIDFERLQNIVFKNGLGSQVEVRREGEKIIISLGNRLLFGQNSSQLEPGKARFLAELAPLLQSVPGTVELRGYAEASESLLDPDPLKMSMYLSSRRAITALHFLRSHNVPSEKMVAHGFGTLTSKKNPTGSGGEVSRQVEIICDYRAKIPYKLREKPGKEDVPLDFKGFMFELRERKGE